MIELQVKKFSTGDIISVGTAAMILQKFATSWQKRFPLQYMADIIPTDPLYLVRLVARESAAEF
jgi:hypothetical protein